VLFRSWNLSILPLVLPQKLQGLARGGEIAFRRRRERRPERVPSEEPGVPGPLALACGAESCEQSGAELWVRRQPFVDSNLRPAERGIEAWIWRRKGDRVAIEALVVIRRLVVQRLERRNDS